MDFRDAIAHIVAGMSLSELEAQRAMEVIMNGEATPSQIAAFLAALRMKGETVEEITGFARTMRAKAIPVKTSHPSVVDTCGTGGDARQTFNISTTAAFVVAGAGLPVAKHGNRSISSRCGSADVLEQLGVQVAIPPAAVERCLEEIGIGFMFAPSFHGAMRHAAGPRKEIGIRTVFNVLGPITNPAVATAQVLGVYDGRLTEVVAGVLQRLGTTGAFVVHGSDGLDEATITGETKVTILREGRLRTFYLAPEEVGLARAPLQSILGGTSEENAAITKEVLQGRPGPCRDVVLLNASLAMVAGGKADTLREGVELAAGSIDSGAALAKLEQLISFTKGCAA